MAKVLIDPLSRIEGHLSIEIDVIGKRVTGAKSKGDMYRGFENILIGRNPIDANMITQRICGVCPISHAIASSKCLESAFGVIPGINGILLRNLILAANFIQSHILHFYHLAALDYVDIKAVLQYQGNDTQMKKIKTWAAKEIDTKATSLTAVSPFLPRYEGKDFYIKDTGLNIQTIANYVKALEIRTKAHKMATLLAGKIPHAASIVPGGITQKIDSGILDDYLELLEEVETFINKTYYEDVINIAQAFPEYLKLGSFNTFLTYGVFENESNTEYLFKKGYVKNKRVLKFKEDDITEHIRYAKFKGPGRSHPKKADTNPAPYKGGAYSWVKAPRYKNNAVEVGPLARIAVNYYSNDETVKSEVQTFLSRVGKKSNALFSVMGRHAARVIECKILCKEAKKWLTAIDLKANIRQPFIIPDNSEGYGMTEAPRGALGHWITIKNQKIERYQCVVPTTWNASPKDNYGNMGPIEQALLHAPITDLKNPIEAARIVRSFDPCLACAIHITDGNDTLYKYRVT